MELQSVLFLTFVVTTIICSWICIVTSREVYNGRMDMIEKEIKSLGGNIIGIEQVQRTNFPFKNEYHEIELSYKFYKVKYDLRHELKEGWAILGMKQDWYAPNGAIDSKWMWLL